MSHFIANIDEANGRVTALEKQLGLTRSEFIDNLDAANARIAELEGRTTTKLTTTKAVPGGNLAALKARRIQLCAALGIEARYQPECKTAAEYEASIAKLEARYEASKVPTPAAPVAPVRRFNATIARFKTGKTTGLEKAIGAATARAEA